MKTIHYLCGLQRTGSTLLACLLNQHPEIHATATSPLLDILLAANSRMEECAAQYTFDLDSKIKILTSVILNQFHSDIDKPIVIDKHRGWPTIISELDKLYKKPKLICTNRSVPEILSSFIQLINKNNKFNNYIDNQIRSKSLPISINNRADFLFNEYVNPSIMTINKSLNLHRENFYFVEYDDIINSPQDTMNGIYQFLGVESVNHNFDCIENTCKEEKDYAWGIENLHIIRNKLQKTSTPPEEVLGKELTEYYRQFDIKYS